MPSQGFQQVQKQTQQLVLAPQLRQSLKILQVPAFELRNAILEELQTNPTLEELPMDGMSLEAPEASTNTDSTPEDTSEFSDNSAPEPEPSASDQELDFKEDFSVYNEIDEDYRSYMAEENGSYSYSAEDDEKRQHFFDSITSESSLQEELMRQAELSDYEPSVIEALEYLVGSLDDRGFLTTPLQDLSLMANLPLMDLQEAHRLLKSLEPTGIGATNLRECLLMQLEVKGKRTSIAYLIIRDQYELLLRRRIPELARKIGVFPDDVQESIEEIAQLDPAPGRKFGDDTNRIVVPDVKVYRDEDEGEWIVILNNDYIPRLRTSSAYKEMIAKGLLKKRDKEFIQDKFRASKFLISSIEQRQQTIERITRVLLDFQSGFFNQGASKLSPLTMNQVAEVVGVHETTISRAIANKYIDTPHGIFEFKYFFTTGLQSSGGSSVSNTSVKEQIKGIVESENTAKPYSDQKIAEILKEKGIKIARRTVAKYREELGILATNLRRRYD